MKKTIKLTKSDMKKYGVKPGDIVAIAADMRGRPTNDDRARNWVRVILREYASGLSYKVSGDKVIAFEKAPWGVGNFAVAKCSPYDRFNEAIGMAVATAKYYDIDIPAFL